MALLIHDDGGDVVMTDAAGDDATKESTTTTTTTSSTKVEKKEDSSDAAGIIRTYNNKERKSAIKYRHKRRVRRWCTIYSKYSGLALEYLLQVGTAIPIPRDWVLRPLMEGRAGQGVYALTNGAPSTTTNFF